MSKEESMSQALLKDLESLVATHKEIQAKQHEPETATLESLVPGTMVYYVHALGYQSFTTEYMILRKPKPGTGPLTDSLFVDVWVPDGKYMTEFSLRDANVIANTYNQHKLFLSKSKAEDYLAYCKKK